MIFGTTLYFIYLRTFVGGKEHRQINGRPISNRSKMDFLYFSWPDYTIFALMFDLGIAVGLYFRFLGKQRMAKDYLSARNQIKVI